MQASYRIIFWGGGGNVKTTATFKISTVTLQRCLERLHIEGSRPHACSESKMDIRKYFRSQASTSGHESVTQSKNDGGSDTETAQPS